METKQIIEILINILQIAMPLVVIFVGWLYTKITKKKLAEGTIAKVLNSALAHAKATVEKPITNAEGQQMIYKKNLMDEAINFVELQKRNNNDFKTSLKKFGVKQLEDFGSSLIKENLERLLHGKKLGLPKFQFSFTKKW